MLQPLVGVCVCAVLATPSHGRYVEMRVSVWAQDGWIPRFLSHPSTGISLDPDLPSSPCHTGWRVHVGCLHGADGEEMNKGSGEHADLGLGSRC